MIATVVRRRSRIGEHAGQLTIEDTRHAQPAAAGQIDQLVVGQAAPEKEREPRRELVAAERMALAVVRRGGRNGAVQKIRAREHRARE